MTLFPQSARSHSVFAFACAYLLFMAGCLFFLTDFWYRLDGENNFIELSGAIALFVTSGYLFYSAKLSFQRKHPLHESALLVGAGLLFFFAGGEEMSWGQHLFGWGTPEWLGEVNGQNETNLHNINKKAFDRWMDRITFVFAATTVTLHLLKREHVIGFRMPEAPIALGYLLLPVYRRLDVINLDLWDLSYFVALAYGVSAVLRKDRKMLRNFALYALTVAVVFYVHRYHAHLLGRNSNTYHEIRETLFAYLCLAYGVQVYLDTRHKHARA